MSDTPASTSRYSLKVVSLYSPLVGYFFHVRKCFSLLLFHVSHHFSRSPHVSHPISLVVGRGGLSLSNQASHASNGFGRNENCPRPLDSHVKSICFTKQGSQCNGCQDG